MTKTISEWKTSLYNFALVAGCMLVVLLAVIPASVSAESSSSVIKFETNIAPSILVSNTGGNITQTLIRGVNEVQGLVNVTADTDWEIKISDAMESSKMESMKGKLAVWNGTLYKSSGNIYQPMFVQTTHTGAPVQLSTEPVIGVSPSFGAKNANIPITFHQEIMTTDPVLSQNSGLKYKITMLVSATTL